MLDPALLIPINVMINVFISSRGQPATLVSRAAGHWSFGLSACVEPVVQEEGGAAVRAHAQSHWSSARWAERAQAVLLRWQC